MEGVANKGVANTMAAAAISSRGMKAYPQSTIISLILQETKCAALKEGWQTRGQLRGEQAERLEFLKVCHRHVDESKHDTVTRVDK